MPPHKGSLDTFNYIAKWIAPTMFFSTNDIWHRMGMLGVLGDYIVSSVEGAIAEIGVGESSIYLSHVARKYSRKIYHCDIARDKIINPLTVAGYLLPEARDLDAEKFKLYEEGNSTFYAGSSDDFFREIQMDPLALSFIDGDHCYEQAIKDFINFLALTVDNGFIILHDTNPPTEEYLDPNTKCGTVYKLREELEGNKELDCITLTRNVAMGVGLTICRKRPKERKYFQT